MFDAKLMGARVTGDSVSWSPMQDKAVSRRNDIATGQGVTQEVLNEWANDDRVPPHFEGHVMNNEQEELDLDPVLTLVNEQHAELVERLKEEAHTDPVTRRVTYDEDFIYGIGDSLKSNIEELIGVLYENKYVPPPKPKPQDDRSELLRKIQELENQVSKLQGKQGNE